MIDHQYRKANIKLEAYVNRVSLEEKAKAYLLVKDHMAKLGSLMKKIETEIKDSDLIYAEASNKVLEVSTDKNLRKTIKIKTV